MLKQLLRRSRGLHAARRVLASAMAACLLLALLPAPARAADTTTAYIGYRVKGGATIQVDYKEDSAALQRQIRGILYEKTLQLQDTNGDYTFERVLNAFAKSIHIPDSLPNNSTVTVLMDTQPSLSSDAVYYPNWESADNPGEPADILTIPFTVYIGPRPTVEDRHIYANGAPLIIDGTSKTSTTIYLDVDRDGVRDPEDPSLHDLGIDGAPEDGANLFSSFWSVYGGCHDADLEGDTQITLLGGGVNSLYGGGQAETENANVSGSATIRASGGEAPNIRGGGYVYGERTTANIGGGTSVSIGGTAKAESVYGGGEVFRPGGAADVTGTAAVTMTGGQVTASLHGGGYAQKGTATVDTTQVSISGGTVKGVYGGGLASNSGTTSTVSGGTILRISGSAAVTGNVYGGGHTESSSASATVGSNSTVDVSGSATVTGSIYGGGYASYGAAPAVADALVTVGGSVKIGGEGKGIVLNGGTETPVTNGVDTFKLGALTNTASVYVVLPDGAAAGDVIATSATGSDMSRLHLTGPGAAGLTAQIGDGQVKLAAAATLLPTVDQRNRNIYANGSALIIDGTSNTSTTIYVDVNRNGVLDPEDQSLKTLGITDAPADGFNFSSGMGWTVYGGCHNDDLEGNTQITLRGGYVGSLYGGGQADTDGDSANVSGSASIQADGGEVWGIYGGGYANAEHTTANIGGSTSISIGGAKAGTIFGGGYARYADAEANVAGIAAVTVTGGQVTSSLYGGGTTAFGTATVGKSTVHISGGTVTSTLNGICGGGMAYNGAANANVTGAATVSISGNAAVNGNVYGGGYAQTAGVSASINGQATVVIADSAAVNGSVYGGGRSQAAGATANIDGVATVSLLGNATVSGTVYGGGLSQVAGATTSVTRAVNVFVSDNATASGSVYGGGRAQVADATATVGPNSLISVGDSATVGGSIYGGGEVQSGTAPAGANLSVSVSGGATIGGAGAGIVLNGGTDTPVTNGVDTFVLGALREGASVYVVLPDDAAAGDVIATNALSSDRQYLHLTGPGAEGLMVRLDGSQIKLAAIPILPPTADADRKILCANGMELLLTAGATADTTKVSYRAPGSTGPYTPLAVEGATGSPESGYDLTQWTVYGGGNRTAVDGDTRITMEGGAVEALYGGGYLSGATVGGSTCVAVNGGTVNYVYGSGNGNAVTGGTDVSIGADATAGTVYGGGYGAVGTAGGGNTVAVTVAGTVAHDVYGGGRNAVTGDVSITVAETGTVKGHVYCGGRYTVTGDVSVTVAGRVGGSVWDDQPVSGAIRVAVTGTVEGNILLDTYDGTNTRTVTVSGGATVTGTIWGVDLETLSGGTLTIGDPLTETACIRVCPPYGAPDGTVVATGAHPGDEDHIFFLGSGTADKIAYFEDGAIKMRTRGAELLYNISGTVTHIITSAPVEGTVRLMQNGAVLQEQPFANEGYLFTGVKPGIYNIVAVMAGAASEAAVFTNTILVTVKDRSLTDVDLLWNDGGVNSEVQIQPNTPLVAVGGLDKIAAGYDTRGPEAFGVVRLTVQAVDDPADKGDIVSLAGGRTLAYWDLSLSFLYTDGTEMNLGDSNDTVLELVLPYDFTNKRDVTVYRKHGAQAAALTALPGAPDAPEDGTFWADTASGYLHIYASKFSTYAVGYTPVSTSGGGGGGGGSNTTTSTTTNADGSTTTTVTNRVTGAVTETTKAPDGTKTVVETKKDGSRTETVTTPDGTKTETATTAQGNKTYTEQRPDGTQIRADIPKTGDAAATVHLPGNAAAPVAVSFPVNDGTVVLRLLPDGTEEPVAYSLVEDGRVYVRLDGDAKLRVETRAGLFTDMDGHWAAESADFTGARELFQGTAPQIFTPERSMTRAMFATVLHRLDGTPDAGAVPFTDVEAGSWCADGVAWAAENGIASGTGGGLFRGDRAITRQELAVMLWNYAKYDGLDVSVGENTNILSFTDIDKAGEWAMPALQWACGAGILQGGADGTLNPTGTATRAQVAAILERFVAAAVK